MYLRIWFPGLRPGSAALLRVAAVADTIPLGSGKPPVSVQPGDIVFNSFKNAHLNVCFPFLLTLIVSLSDDYTFTPSSLRTSRIR